ncbi:hypothetical protein C8F01DRAFT_1275346, partial [Mycena amicta]
LRCVAADHDSRATDVLIFFVDRTTLGFGKPIVSVPCWTNIKRVEARLSLSLSRSIYRNSQLSMVIAPSLSRYSTSRNTLKASLYRPPSPADTVVPHQWQHLPPPPPSPLATFPPAILARIFSLAAPSSQIVGQRWQVRSGTNEARDILAHKHLLDFARVCQAWRAVVLGEPRLWSALEVDFDARWPSPRGLEKLIEICIVRSRDMPLTLHVRLSDPEMYRSCLKLLTTASPRWRILNLAMQGLKPDTQWLTAVDGNVPLLETIHMAPHQLIPLENAPKLKQVLTTLPLAHLPWPQLENTYLRICGRLQTVLRLVRPLALYTENLHLALDLYPSAPGGGMIYVPALHSPVKQLHLTLWDWTRDGGYSTKNILDTVVSRMHLPSLSALTIASPTLVLSRNSSPDSTPTPTFLAPMTFRAFITRSEIGVSLRTLALLNVAIDPHALPACLAVLPGLVALTLSDVPGFPAITTDVLKRLVPHLSNSTNNLLLPNLRALTLESSMHFDPAALCELVLTRGRWVLFCARMQMQRQPVEPFKVQLNAHLPSPTLIFAPPVAAVEDNSESKSLAAQWIRTTSATDAYHLEHGRVLRAYGVLRCERLRMGLTADELDARLVDGLKKRALKSGWAEFW